MREREVDGDNIPSPKTTSISSRGTPLVSGYTEVQGKLLMTAYKSEKEVDSRKYTIAGELSISLTSKREMNKSYQEQNYTRKRNRA